MKLAITFIVAVMIGFSEAGASSAQSLFSDSSPSLFDEPEFGNNIPEATSLDDDEQTAELTAWHAAYTAAERVYMVAVIDDLRDRVEYLEEQGDALGQAVADQQEQIAQYQEALAAADARDESIDQPSDAAVAPTTEPSKAPGRGIAPAGARHSPPKVAPSASAAGETNETADLVDRTAATLALSGQVSE